MNFNVNVKSKRDKSTASVACEAPTAKDAIEKVSATMSKHLVVVSVVDESGKTVTSGHPAKQKRITKEAVKPKKKK